MEAEHLINQQFSNQPIRMIQPNQEPSKNGIFNPFLSSEKDCSLATVENLEANSTGLKSSQTRGVWHKSLEELHSAQIKDKSLLGHLVCLEETQRKILEPDIFPTFESDGTTEIGGLYKVSHSKFVLAFRSKAGKEKLHATEIQCRFGDSEICLNFRERISPLRNRKEPIFMTFFFPEFIS